MRAPYVLSFVGGALFAEGFLHSGAGLIMAGIGLIIFTLAQLGTQ